MAALKALARKILGENYAAIAEAVTHGRLKALERQVASLDRRVRCDLAATLAATSYPDVVPQPGPDLTDHELRIFSQNGEDGILLHLLAATGAPNRRLVEVGIGNGTECNSAYLLQKCGWSGTLMEGDPAGAASASELYSDFDDVDVHPIFVTVENVNGFMPGHPIDILSIDVDGNDYWIWKAIEADPLIVVIEYNASLGPQKSLTIPYDPAFDYTTRSDHLLYHGASLAALTRLGADRGMSLVGCDSQGVNAFFVRQEFTGEHLPALNPIQAWRPIQKRLRRWTHEQQEKLLEGFEYVRID